MLELTRRRDPTRPEECWRVHYGDVCVGTIARRNGAPGSEPPWEWSCGFYPGTKPGEHQTGTAETFEAARADFEAAWEALLANRTEADFQAWQQSQVFTAWKHAMWEAGMKLPTQTTSGVSRCFCGATIDIAGTEAHVYSEHMIRGTAD
ncbi:hypothetical protein [Bradyrhizobium elkanii]|uniref:hypothetical protein n=1 Tax=Bradyrhizobium elkanii TaxID=29448 RepID=UPI0003F8650E|nr:hypothetical protein [Bradyrhizobium elkanii]